METRGITRILSTAALLGAVLALPAGCRKADGPDGGGAVKTTLDIRVSVDGTRDAGGVETRSVVTGNTLNQSGRTYGIIACEHEDSPAAFRIYDADDANIYGNIQAKYSGSRWVYGFEPTVSATFYPLFFVTQDTSRHMDLYAYAPWKRGITVGAGYEYDLALVNEPDIPDLMYATYEDGDGNRTNRDITFVNNANIPVDIHFHHALSRIAFHFRLAKEQYAGLDGWHAMRLWQIDLRRSESSATPLYTHGTMDLLTGEVTHMGKSQEQQTVTYATALNRTDAVSTYDVYKEGVWKTFNMLVHPTGYEQDGDFSFRFFFNGNTPSTQAFIQDYPIPMSDLRHGDGTCGFQPGFCYHFYFVIDNYIHLQDVVIDTDWTSADETEIKI